MPNTSDLRYVKTEHLIEDTYLRLKRKSRAPIKVSELCEAALINKTTFYTHYETMESLHEHICVKQIESMLDECDHIDDAFTNTADFVHSIVKIIRDNASASATLFGADSTKQTNIFEACLLKRYLRGDETEEMEMKIIFAIGGAARLLIESQSDERVQMTIKLIGRVLDNPV